MSKSVTVRVLRCVVIGIRTLLVNYRDYTFKKAVALDQRRAKLADALGERLSSSRREEEQAVADLRASYERSRMDVTMRSSDKQLALVNEADRLEDVSSEVDELLAELGGE